MLFFTLSFSIYIYTNQVNFLSFDNDDDAIKKSSFFHIVYFSFKMYPKIYYNKLLLQR